MAVSEAESKLIDKTGKFQIGNAQTALTAAETSHNMTGFDSVNIGVLDNAMDALGARINELETLCEYHRLALDN